MRTKPASGHKLAAEWSRVGVQGQRGLLLLIAVECGLQQTQ